MMARPTGTRGHNGQGRWTHKRVVLGAREGEGEEEEEGRKQSQKPCPARGTWAPHNQKLGLVVWFTFCKYEDSVPAMFVFIYGSTVYVQRCEQILYLRRNLCK